MAYYLINTHDKTVNPINTSTSARILQDLQVATLKSRDKRDEIYPESTRFYALLSNDKECIPNTLVGVCDSHY